MSKNAKRYQYQQQTNQHQKQQYLQQDEGKPQIEYVPASNKPLEALTSTQAMHKSSLIHDVMVVGIGPAGVGKTYMASAVAAELYLQKHFKYLILTRPNVEVGKSLGFLPGELDEKYAPYLEPFKKGLLDRMGSQKFTCDYMKRILPKPLGFMRGDTFDNSIVLLDECQNTTVQEMKMLLTRIGYNSKLFITGDTAQSDIGPNNGLAWLVSELRRQQKPYDIIEYQKSECVRSDFCKDMLDMIEKSN